jgi:diacylglycerol kinase family enzyme
MMASWVPDLGGLFSGVTSRPSVMDNRMHVQLVRGPAWLSLPAWLLLGGRGPWVSEIDPDELRCIPLNNRPIYAQADAEPMGTLPITLRFVPNALKLLTPPVR